MSLSAERSDRFPLVCVSMGDPSGIGAEVIVKALSDPEVRGLGRFAVYGVEDMLAAAADDAGIAPFWFRLGPGEPLRVDSGVVVVDHPDVPLGLTTRSRPTQAAGRASLSFLSAAAQVVLSGDADALVTGPIHKTAWKLAGCRFPGHTEWLSDAARVKRVTMAFVGGGLRLALASAHMGLLELRNHFTIGLVFQPIDLLHQALTGWFGIDRPKIAVLGLNPHAGENGLLGDEERRVIEPAIRMACEAGMDICGPFPADTFFTPARRASFDGVVAMYHDQGLIPVKMLAFDTAVNVTLGLPFIRTSPDHGTAFDIAGTNRADASSMKEALRLACQLARLGTQGYRNRNPLDLVSGR